MKKNPRTDTDQIVIWCDDIIQLAEQIQQACGQIDPEPPDPEPEPPITVNAGDDLQAALTTGGTLVMAAEACFAKSGGFDFVQPGTSLTGLGGNTVSGDRGPALDFPLNYHGGHVEQQHLEVTGGYEIVCLMGRNDSSQVDPAVAPADITVKDVTAGPHVGKRAFEVNARDVVFDHCHVVGVYDDQNADSQAIWIGNSPGGIKVLGGYYEAASECLMVGGDNLKLEGNTMEARRPTDIQVMGTEFCKPAAWQEAGTPKVKNIFELKDGHDVLVKDCLLHGCWKSAQDGYCFMFTPTRGGSLRNVRVENCVVWDVGGIVNITGIDYNWDDERPRTQVEIVGGRYETNTAAFPGTGRFCLITNGPEYFKVSQAFIRHQASSFIGVEDKHPVDQLHVIGCDWNYGSYGIRIGGYSHGDNNLGIVGDIRVEGCTITGAHSQFRDRYPNNTYIDSMSASREREVDSHEAVAAMERDIRAELKRMREWLT